MQWVKYLRILKNITDFFLNAWFVEKKTFNNKNLDTTSFPYSTGVRKSLFCCSRPEDTPVMSICLQHIENDSTQSIFSHWFCLFCSEERCYTETLTQYLILLFMANMMVQNVTRYILLFICYHHLVSACNLFPDTLCINWSFCCCYFIGL